MTIFLISKKKIILFILYDIKLKFNDIKIYIYNIF